MHMSRHAGPDTAAIAAMRGDYITPEDCTTWVGYAPQGEYAVAFLDADGAGLMLLTHNPDGYVLFSAAMNLGDDAPDLPWNTCPHEWEMEGLDVSGDSMHISTGCSL